MIVLFVLNFMMAILLGGFFAKKGLELVLI
jgi:hypothetical protein